jgi:exodeoxyribonuclease-3
VRVASVYVPNGRTPDSPFYADKLRFLEAMAERIRALSGTDFLVAGDFNVCPTDLDVYDPAAFVGETHVTAPERERFSALLDAGAVDAFRSLRPDEPGFTWWDYRAGHFHKKMGLRIDAVLLAPSLAERLAECGIDRNFRKGPKPSDHAPLLAELR